MTRLLRLFPREWRERYGQEVEEALEHSSRPARDRLDLVRAAVSVRGQDVRSRLERAVRRAGLGVLSGAALVLAGAAGTWWSQANLSGGVGEIPRHWWSTAACLPLAAAALLAAWSSAGRFRNRRRRAREERGQSL
jgi:hypothetical protein